MPEQPQPDGIRDLPDQSAYGWNVTYVPANKTVPPCPYPCAACQAAGRQ